MQKQKNVAIVGSGLVGSLLAIFLRKQGHKVIIFDRRPDVRLVEFSGRSINLAMSNRGWKALREAGVEKDIRKLALPLDKRAMHVEGWKKVTESVHEEGGKIFIQLWHVGRISHPKFHNGEKPLAPSAINPNADVFTPDGEEKTVDPKAMSLQEIQETVQEFKTAAQNAKDAGFDGVEIHSSNGYLIHQFFNKNANQRNDDYGGSIPNRARFFFEVLDAITEVWPENRIGCRFNPSLHKIFGIVASEESIETFDYIINKLNSYDLAYVHLSEPFNDVSDVPYLITDIAKHYRKIYKGTLMINAGFDRESGNKVIEEGDADLVSYAKWYISNPDLAERFANNWPLAEYNEDTFYTPGKEGYIDYPTYQEGQSS